MRHQSSKYLANVLARTKCGGSGADRKWAPSGALEIAFTPPMPGAPRISRRVHYRTVSTKMSKYHCAPWRAKGFINSTPRVRFAVRPWFDVKDQRFHEGYITVSNGEESVRVRADIVA